MKRLKSDDGLEIGAAADATAKANAARDAAIAAAPVKSVNGLTGDVVIPAPVPSYRDYCAIWSPTALARPIYAGVYNYMAISCSYSGQYVLASRYNKLDYSLDYGRTWATSSYGVYGTVIRCVWVSYTGTRWYAIDNTTHKIIVSRDHGETWSNLANVPNANFDYYFIAGDDDEQRIFVSCGSDIDSYFYLSLNGGSTWPTAIGQYDSGYAAPFVAVSKNMKSFYRGRRSVAKASNDYGATWTDTTYVPSFCIDSTGDFCLRRNGSKIQRSTTGPLGSWADVAGYYNQPASVFDYITEMIVADGGARTFWAASTGYNSRYMEPVLTVDLTALGYGVLPPAFGRNKLTKLASSGDMRFVFGIAPYGANGGDGADAASCIWRSEAQVSL